MSNTHTDPIIVLVRHPESDSNVHLHRKEKEIPEDVSDDINKIGDPNITEKGKLQAELTVDYLVKQFKMIKSQKFPTVKIYKSNCRRTHYMADLATQRFKEILSENHVFSAEADERLQEYTNPKKLVPESFLKDDTPESFLKRIYNFFGTFLEDTAISGDHNLDIFFGHSMYWAVVITYVQLINANPKLTYREYLDYFINSETGSINVSFEVPNCSISTLRYDRKNSRWVILGFGKNEHLLEELKTGIHSVF